MGSTGEVYCLGGMKFDGSGFAQFSSELQATESKIGEFQGASSSLMAGAFAAPAVAVAGIAAAGISVASGLQDAGTSLTNLYGSADIAREKFQWMTKFAAETPFSFDEVEEGAIKLKAYGMDIETYGRTFGDTAAGMGKSFDQVIEAVADAQTGEFERLKELGIKAVQVTKANLDQYAAQGASVGDTMLTYTNRAGEQCATAVDRNNRQMITSTLETIWNEKYSGAMQTRSQTLSGMASTIKDNLSFALADLVGYNLKTMEVDSLSLMGVMMNLAQIAGTLTAGLTTIPEPIQTFVIVAGLGVAAIGLLAAGFIGYSAILPLATGGTAIFGVTLSAAILPITAVVVGAALLAAGLMYLDEKTGILSAAWGVMSDLFTIAWSRITTGFTAFTNAIIQDIQQIQVWVSNIFPPAAVSVATNAIDWITSKAQGWATQTHADAESIKTSNQAAAVSYNGPLAAVDRYGISVNKTGGEIKNTTVAATNSGTAFQAAGVGYNAAAGGLANTTKQANGTTVALNATTQAALNAAQATKQLWAAQNEVAKTEITKAQAAINTRDTYAAEGGKGTTSPSGVKVIAASNSSSSTSNSTTTNYWNNTFHNPVSPDQLKAAVLGSG